MLFRSIFLIDSWHTLVIYHGKSSFRLNLLSNYLFPISDFPNFQNFLLNFQFFFQIFNFFSKVTMFFFRNSNCFPIFQFFPNIFLNFRTFPKFPIFFLQFPNFLQNSQCLQIFKFFPNWQNQSRKSNSKSKADDLVFMEIAMSNHPPLYNSKGIAIQELV